MRPMGAWFAEQGVSVVGVRLPAGTTGSARRPWTEWASAVANDFDGIRERCTSVLVLAQSFEPRSRCASRPSDAARSTPSRC